MANERFRSIVVVIITLGMVTFLLSGCPNPDPKPTLSEQLSPPAFSLLTGSYVGDQVVSITADDGTIKFTTDGTNPTEINGMEYTSSITLTSSTTLKAIALKDGFIPSEVTSAYYEIEDPTQLSPPQFSLPAGTYVGAKDISIYSDNGTIKYTTDGTNPTETNGIEYTSAITVSSTTTLKAIALQEGLTTSEVASAQYEIVSSAGARVTDSYFWGAWLRIDADEVWNISDRDIVINGISTTIDSATSDVIEAAMITLTRESEDVLSAVDGSDSFKLLRDRGVGTITGRILQQQSETAARSFSAGLGGLGGIEVLISNVRNPSNKQTVVTDTEGNWSFDQAIPGEEYTIEPQPSTATSGKAIPVVNVKPTEDGEDVGSVIFTEERRNFKVTAEKPAGYMYANGDTYTVILKIKNIGTEDSLATEYYHTADSGLSVSPNYVEGAHDILQSIESGSERTVELQVSCSSLTETYADKKIGITLHDVSGYWDDSITLRFYREEATVNVSSLESQVNGVIIAPDNKASWFKTSGGTTTQAHSTSVNIPYHSGYKIVFSEASFDTETRYSFGINRPASSRSDMEVFNNAFAFETNDTETDAVEVATSDLIESYLHVTDYDYYAINAEKVAMPVFTTPGGNYATKPKITEITCSTIGADVYYTRDGSDPDPTVGTLYNIDDNEVITITGTETIKAKAYKSGFTDSAIAVEKYVFPSSINVSGYERLLLVDAFTLVEFLDEYEKTYVIEVGSAGEYSFVLSDLSDGDGDDSVNVRATLYESDNSTVAAGLSNVDSAYTTPLSLNLSAGTYYLTLSSGGSAISGSCKVKIY